MGVSAHPDSIDAIGLSQEGNWLARGYQSFALIHGSGHSGVDDLGMPMAGRRSAEDPTVPRYINLGGGGLVKASARAIPVTSRPRSGSRTLERA